MLRTWLSVSLLLSLCALAAGETQAKSSRDAEDRLARAISAGDELYLRGRTREAISEWTKAERLAGDSKNPEIRMDILLRRAEAYQALGFYRRSIGDLQAASRLAETADDDETRARIQGSLGNVHYLMGSAERAQTHFETCLEYARTAGARRLEATTLTNMGNLFTARDPSRAETWYRESYRIAKAIGDSQLAVDALINNARLSIAVRDPESAEKKAHEALAIVETFSEGGRKADRLTRIGLVFESLAATSTARESEFLGEANRLYEESAGIALQTGDLRTHAFALGYRGRLYERLGRNEDALRLTRRALFSAQEADVLEAVYLWQWQMGRLYRAEERRDLALAAYRDAATTLRQLRRDALAGNPRSRFPLQKDAATVFLELTDLLLARSEGVPNEAESQLLLLEARETMEQLKTAELENYFQDECVAALESTATSIDEVSSTAAAVYPIMFPDRVELLVSLPDRMVRVASPGSSGQVRSSALELRRRLGERTFRYLRPGRELYRDLIAPLEPVLAGTGIDTLVIVPGGVLRTIPFSVLHDGERHLVEKFALVVTPGITLLDPRPIERGRVNLLLGGLTEGVQGFEPLPHVADELEQVHELFGGEVFSNKNFVTKRIEHALDQKPFTLVHLATHARFEADARASFLLTHDGRMTMDSLEEFIKLSRFREEPVELLTLSACETAVGDERAALGLAGVAVKAGARSALASLWLINDEAAAELVTAFYRELKGGAVSKAKALQAAQISLLQKRRYRFPYYWAPFLLIGNWL